MKFSLTALAVTAMMAQTAYAHAYIQWFWPDNTKAGSTQSCVRMPPNNNPIENVNSADLACNINGNVPAASVCSVTAGSTVKIEWHHTSKHQTPLQFNHE